MKRIGQNWLELGLLGLIAVVCLGLSILQYRWTGEVSRAERARLRSGLNEQVLRLSHAFNEEIGENCRALLPGAAEIGAEGFEGAHSSRYKDWASAHERGLFSRIGIAVPEDGELRLYGFDSEGGVAPTEWPTQWETLRASILARVQATGPPPSVSRASTLIELPVFGNSGHRRGPRDGVEWMIFEVDEQHLRATTFPHLMQEYLNPGSDALYEASVSWTDSRGPVVFSTRSDNASVASGADATAGIFPIHISDAPGGGRNRRRFRDEDEPPRWTLAVRHREGSLDAAVTRTRTRNLATSLVLIGLLGGAAWALVQYTSRSRRLAQMQFRFAAGVSHDLRTPLTAIRGAAFNIATGVVSEPEAIGRYAKLILRNSEELTSMIENVLAFSTTLHSDDEEKRERLAIGDVVEHAAATMTQEAEMAGCRIEVAVAPDLPAVAGDPVALELAFRNLIANAARHAAQGKWIGVSAARYGEDVEVRVCDRGPGIPESEQQRIFEPFYRGEQTRASQVRGTGLGLSLVKDTVERHHGTVSVHNSAAGGAQFTVHLPAIPDA